MYKIYILVSTDVWADVATFTHDMRHIGFRRLTMVNETPRIRGVTGLKIYKNRNIGLVRGLGVKTNRIKPTQTDIIK